LDGRVSVATRRKEERMAIGAMFERAGFTSDMYDQVASRVVAEGPPPGCLYHIAGPVEGGWRVIEVWESEEDQRRFQEERLNPAFEAAGVEKVMPRYFEVHATLPPPEAMAALAAGSGPPTG
jgi:hypothetical protein